MSTAYDPKEIEDKIYKIWEESGFFNPDNLKETKSKYSIVIPPPNITGSLHMGHALNATIQDILIRKKRMKGYKTLWLPGTDHAGIATQNVVEKELKKEGKTRHDLGREKFIEKVWEWKDKYGDEILNQLKKLGSSCDWSRTRFTMDNDYQKKVEETFLHYHKKGWIYRAERVINWCPRCQTSISDLEIKYKEEKAKLYWIKYGPFILATTRPETKLGDTAVAVHPSDERYKDMVGKEYDILGVLGKFKIKVVADRSVNPEFGSGAVKVTPAHSIIDSEIAERNNIPSKQIINEEGRMMENCGKYAGLKTGEAREQIVEDMKKMGLIDHIDEDYIHNISLCDRCESIIENLPSSQWFLKMDELAKMAIKSVKDGKVVFHPKRWEKVYLDWMENIRDWCISRQLWWGHKIPIEDSEDVLDTWFSSALWPYATMNEKDQKEFYPTNVLSTARDIINLWVARMVFSGLEFKEEEPFKDVIIHPTILAKSGQRMSKSLGTGVDPMKYIEQYGADATRFGLIWQTMRNQDIHWAEEHVLAGKKFCNKIWNASRFVLEQTKESKPEGISPRLNKITKEVSEDIEKYEFGQALHKLYEFFWHEFCDKDIEEFKKDKQNPGELLRTLITSLKLLHPFIPFITEEIWSQLPIKDKKLLMISFYPNDNN